MSTVTLTKADNGRSIDAGGEDAVALRLPENPTTGFRWQIERIEGSLELVTDTYYPSSDIQFGSGGIREFHFRRTAKGTARLGLKNLQAWEGDRSVTERFEATIIFSE